MQSNTIFNVQADDDSIYMYSDIVQSDTRFNFQARDNSMYSDTVQKNILLLFNV